MADGRWPEPPSLNEADARIFRTDAEDALARSGIPAERLERHLDAIHAGFAEAHRRLRREGLSDRDARVAVLARIPTLGATLAGLDGASPTAPANDDVRDGKVIALNPWQTAADLDAIPGLAGHVYVARLPIEDDEPGQGGWIHWIQDATRYTGMLPVIAGQRGVASVKATLEKSGHKIIGEEVVLNIRGAGSPVHHTARADLVALKPDGKTIIFIEVKTGASVRLTVNQRVGVSAIQNGQAIPVGKGADDLARGMPGRKNRHEPGTPLPPTEVVIVYQPRPTR